MIDDLSMAHDNLQRELADIKQRLGKDKHELIKANIALNKRVQELEDKLARIRFVNNDYDKQNKRYKQALEFYAKEYGADRAIRALEGEK